MEKEKDLFFCDSAVRCGCVYRFFFSFENSISLWFISDTLKCRSSEGESFVRLPVCIQVCPYVCLWVFVCVCNVNESVVVFHFTFCSLIWSYSAARCISLLVSLPASSASCSFFSVCLRIRLPFHPLGYTYATRRERTRQTNKQKQSIKAVSISFERKRRAFAMKMLSK